MSTKKKVEPKKEVAVGAPAVDLNTVSGIRAALERQKVISEQFRTQFYQSQGACEVLAALLQSKIEEEQGGK